MKSIKHFFTLTLQSINIRVTCRRGVRLRRLKCSNRKLCLIFLCQVTNNQFNCQYKMSKFSKNIRNIQIIFILLILTVVLFNIYIFIKFEPPNMKIKSPGDGYSIKTIGCSIPSLNPFDPAIIPLLFKNPPVKCGDLPPLITSELNTLLVNISLLPDYKVTNMQNFNCCYQEIKRKEQPPGMYRELSNDTYTISSVCKQFKIRAQIEEEFVRVICENNGKEIYRDFHSFVRFKKSKAKKPSVLIVGIDSMSRMNLHRQMPKTAAFLQELNAIEFFGYNKVGDNTFPNLIPALTGKSEFELYADCLTSKWLSLPTKFDSCKFIWNNFSRAGFLTVFAEDSSWMGLFNFGHKYGFNKPPTDYYWDFFNYASENELGSNPYNGSIFLCMGPRRIYEVILDYTKKIIYTLRNSSYFGWFWQGSLSHSQINFSSISDEDYKQLFHLLNKTNVLNDTFIIFLSDHGPRHGNIMYTHQGFLESRLPFMYVLVPPWFHELYPKAAQNLKVNSKRLVTTFDIHETLNDLIYIEDLTIDVLEKRTDALEDTRGISLFLPIPETRTCTSAGIPIHFCTCFQSNHLEVTNKVVENIAWFIVSYIVNVLLNANEMCAKLSLDSILDARLFVSEEFQNLGNIFRQKLKLNNYIITLKTSPGGAVFESTVRCYKCDETGDFEIQGGITRLNKFGTDGNCIEDTKLHLYCYCKK